MLSTYYVPRTVLDARDSEVNKSLHFSGGRQVLYKQTEVLQIISENKFQEDTK